VLVLLALWVGLLEGGLSILVLLGMVFAGVLTTLILGFMGERENRPVQFVVEGFLLVAIVRIADVGITWLFVFAGL